MPCPLCKCVISMYLFSEKGYKLYECKDCELIYISPFPVVNNELYDSMEYYDKRGMLNNNIQVMDASRKILLLNKTVHFSKGMRLLDVGSGPGYFVKAAIDQGFDAYGYEVSNVASKYGTDRLGVKVINGESLAIFKDKEFDVVTLFNLLSHLSDPLNYFIEIHRMLKDNGFVLLRIGNKSGIFKYLNRGFWGSPEHLCHFTERSLRYLLNKSGFEIVLRRNAKDSSFPYLCSYGNYFILKSINFIINRLCKYLFKVGEEYIFLKKSPVIR